MAEIYIGPFDNGSAIPPGTTPDWVNPHSCDYRNPAFSVVPATGYPGCVYINLFARNHGNVDVTEATVTLRGVAGTLDWSASIPAQLATLFSSASQITPSPWNHVVLPARPYPYIEANVWSTGQVLWHVPQDYSGKYLLFATVSTSGQQPGPVTGNSAPYDLSRDALVGVWSSVKKPRGSASSQSTPPDGPPGSFGLPGSTSAGGLVSGAALAGLSWIINRRNLLR